MRCVRRLVRYDAFATTGMMDGVDCQLSNSRADDPDDQG